MRLSDPVRKAIVEVIRSLTSGMPVEALLTGSRVDDNAKGGDIDLLLVARNFEDAERIRDLKEKLLAEIKKRIGDQRIDLTIGDPEKFQSHPVLKQMLEKAIPLDG